MEVTSQASAPLGVVNTPPWISNIRSISTGLGLPLAARPRGSRLVVVGNGMVGQRFCERLVALGGRKKYQIVVLGEETTPAYDRVHLTDIWRGRNSQDLLLCDQDWHARSGVQLELGVRVSAIDPQAQSVSSDDGRRWAYDRLVLATGSRVPALPILLEHEAKVFSYRTLDDARAILAAVQTRTATSRSVVVIGAGLLGLEAARSLQQLGCQVIVLEASSQVLPRQLDSHAAAVLLEMLRSAGLEVRTRCRILKVEGRGHSQRVELAEGPGIDAAVVVAAVGARASDDLGRSAALRCEGRGGILVDGGLRTSRQNIFAIGECAHHERVPHGLVAPGYAMAEVLAHNLMGRRRRLGPQYAITRLKLDLTEVTVLGNPLAEGAGDDLIFKRDGVYRRLVVRERVIVAALCIGAWEDLPHLQQLVVTGKRVRSEQLRSFVEAGRLRAANLRLVSVTSLPDNAVICQCANVTCGTLRAALGRGARSPEALARTTAASTLCGSCLPQLRGLCGDTSVTVAAPPSGRALTSTALAVALLVGVWLTSPRLPVAVSVRSTTWDFLWTTSFYKQLSGFTLLGLIALSLLLSARKRLAWLKFGSFSSWRILHASLGLSALCLLVGHTGFRLGHQMNLWLMSSFLVTALTGAGSGFVLASANLHSSAKGWHYLSRATRVLHDWAVWPLLVLLGFHVFKVYYF